MGLFPYSVTFKNSDLLWARVLLSRNSEEQGLEHHNWMDTAALLLKQIANTFSKCSNLYPQSCTESNAEMFSDLLQITDGVKKICYT